MNPAQAGRGHGDVMQRAAHIWKKLLSTATRAESKQVQDVTTGMSAAGRGWGSQRSWDGETPGVLGVPPVVGTLESENFKLAVLTGTDSQENTAFDLRAWRKLPKLSGRTGVTGVEFE